MEIASDNVLLSQLFFFNL